MKRKIMIGAVAALIIGILAAVILFGRTAEPETQAPNILGAWYSTSGTDETITFYDDYDCASSLSEELWTYSLQDSAHVEIMGTQKTLFEIVTDASGQAIELKGEEQSYIRDQAQATAESQEHGGENYATYTAILTFSKILQADPWTLERKADGESLQFEPDRVYLTQGSHKQGWSWTYLDVVVDQSADKPIAIQMQLTPLESGTQKTGMVYLYTGQAENGFWLESELFSADNTQQRWIQKTSEESLIAADDSNQEGENTTIAGSGGAGAATTYSDSYSAEDDPFSASFAEPKPGDIDPETNKKIKTYIRKISGDTCTITIVYDDGTSSTQTMTKDPYTAREKVKIDYAD